jgi:hypothetical protein
MIENQQDAEKRFERFLELKKRRIDSSVDISGDVMAKIQAMGEPGAPSRYTSLITNLFLKPAVRVAWLGTVLLAGALFYFLRSTPSSVDSERLAHYETRTKGETFSISYLLQPSGEDSLIPAPGNGVYAAGDRLQPLYWADRPYLIHLFSTESPEVINCLNCSSIKSPAPPAQGKPLAMAIELDNSPRTEILLAFAAESPTRERILKNCIAECWQSGAFNESELTHNPACRDSLSGYWSAFKLRKK